MLATAAMAFVSGPALAADKMSVGVGGYMQQWFGYADRGDKGAEGGWAVQSDSEIFFKGSLESDAGLTYSVHVELEGDAAATTIDESFVSVSGEFGKIEFGGRDHAMVWLHSGISDVGIGLTVGDTQKWIPGAYLDTYGHGGTAGGGNDQKLNYISPRVSGLQVGVSYAPEDGAGVTEAPGGNDGASWGVGLNFKQAFGDGDFTVSLGHRNVDSAGKKHSFMTGMGALATRLTPNDKARQDAAIKAYADALAKGTGGNLQPLAAAAKTANDAIEAATDCMAMKGDGATYTNAGAGVGFGAFKFNVSYATSDGGAYKAMDTLIPMTSADVTALNAGVSGANPPYSLVDGKVIDSRHTYKDGTETASNNHPGNDTWAAQKIVDDKSKNFDVWGVSVTYTEGPMAVSLGHMTHETDASTERNATMLSASYTLAPGIAWKTSLFAVEDDTGVDDKETAMDDESDAEGTGFVTGIALSF